MDHTGQYKYFCEVCRKGFARKYVYEEHMMMAHMREKENSNHDYSDIQTSS